jgi:hypothetical protein
VHTDGAPRIVSIQEQCYGMYCVSIIILNIIVSALAIMSLTLNSYIILELDR